MHRIENENQGQQRGPEGGVGGSPLQYAAQPRGDSLQNMAFDFDTSVKKIMFCMFG